MLLDLDQLPANQVYFTLIQSIVPRPIAWLLTQNEDAVLSECINPEQYNLAPFSYFTPVSSSPAVLAVSIGKKPDGTEKDTLANLKRHKKATLHIASIALAEELNESSRTRPYGESEIAAQQLSLVQQTGFVLPRLENCPVAFDCELYDIYEIGEAPQSVVFLKVNKAWFSDEIASLENGRTTINIDKLNPLARLGTDSYAGLSNSFSIPRPK